MTVKHTGVLCLSAALFLWAASWTPAAAQSAEDFYKGKQVTLESERHQ